MTSDIKKMPVNELRAQISEMVKEEIASFLAEQQQQQVMPPSAPDSEDQQEKRAEEEETNAFFSKIKDKPEFIAWVMKHYFSPSRKGMPWYNANVTPENVLAYVSNPKNHFPLSPKELRDDWFIKRSLKGSMTSLKDKDVEDFEKNVQPQQGSKAEEMSLKDVGEHIGLTAAMINRIEQTGMEKFLKFLGGKNPLDMDEAELDALMQNVDNERRATSVEFARNLKAAGGDIKAFLDSLLKSQIITQHDLKLLEPKEIEMLMYLMNKPENEIAEYLRGDAARSENRMKTFQAAVAHKLNPGGKRGRPLGSTKKPQVQQQPGGEHPPAAGTEEDLPAEEEEEEPV